MNLRMMLNGKGIRYLMPCVLAALVFVLVLPPTYADRKSVV